MESIKTILIIDDELPVRFTLKKLLAKYLRNVRIFTSEDGIQGVGYAYILKPDLVIIDSTLPKYSGRELIDYLITNNKFQNIPIVLLNEEGVPKNALLPNNYNQIEKNSKEFPSSLINLVLSKLNNSIPGDNTEPPRNFTFKLLNFLSKKIITYSNSSDKDFKERSKSNFFINVLNSVQFLFNQVLLGLYLTLFYILMGRKEKEENIDQLEKDHLQFRSKLYPAIGLTLAVILFVFLQLVLIIGGIASVTFFGKQIVSAASYTWDGGGATNNWSDCDNWSTNICPVAGDNVTFNGTSVKDSTIDASWGGSITSVIMASGYSGTLILGRTLTVSSALTQQDGIFNANGNVLTVGGNVTLSGGTMTLSNGADFNAVLTISGGTFNAPSGNMTLAAALTITNHPETTTFNHNNGTFIFDGPSQNISCDDVTFNLISIINSGSKTVQSNCILPLGNNPVSGGGTINLHGTLTGSGTISKNITFHPTGAISGFDSYNGTLTMSGGTVDLSTYTSFTSNIFTINSGTLTLPDGSDVLTFTMTGGTFNAPSGTMFIRGGISISGTTTFNHNNGTISLIGNGTFSCNNVVFNTVAINFNGGTSTINSDCTFPIGNNPSFAAIPGHITLNGTLVGTGTITGATGRTITLNSGSVLSGFSGLNLGFLTIAGATMDFSNYTSFVASGNVTVSSGSLSLPSGADLNSGLIISGGTFTAPSGTLTLAGALTISGSPTFNHNSGTFTFDGGIATLSCNNVTFNLVTFVSNSTKTVNSNCSLPLGNNPTIASAVTINGTLSGSGVLNHTLNTLIFNSGGALSGFSGLTGTAFTIAGATMDFSSYSPFTTTSFTLTSGSVDIPDNAVLGASGSGLFTLTSGTFNAPSGTLTVGNTLNSAAYTISSGVTFNHNGGTINFFKNGNTLSCGNKTFNQVNLQSGSIIISADCSLPLGANPTIPPGVTLNGTLSGSGTLTKTGVAAFTLNSGSSLSGFSGIDTTTIAIAGATADFSSYGTFIASSTVTLSSGSLTFPSGADLNGALTVSGGTLNAPTGDWYLDGGLSITGSPTFNHNNGTLDLDGSSGSDVINCNNITIASLVNFTHTGGFKQLINCQFTLGNNPHIGTGASTGTRLDNASTLTGSGKLTVIGNLYNLGTPSTPLIGFNDLEVTGIFTINSSIMDLASYSKIKVESLHIVSGTFTAPQLTQINRYMQNQGGPGSFIHNNGTVEFIGNSSILMQIWSGSSNFYNLTVDLTSKSGIIPTMGFTGSGTQTIEGLLKLKGTSETLLTVQNLSVYGSDWVIDVQGNAEVEYLDVAGSQNIGNIIQAGGRDVTNSGNNTGWNFSNPGIIDIEVQGLTNGSTNDTTPTIGFSINNDDDPSEMVQYNIQIDNNEDFGSPELEYTSPLEAQGAKTYTLTTPLSDGTYYLKIKGIDSEGGDSGFTNGDSFIIDTTGPSGQLVLGYVVDSANPNIYIITTASDPTGVDKIIYSENSNFNGSSYVDYKQVINYELSSGFEYKRIYVKFKDKLGNESQVYSASILYSQTATNEDTNEDDNEVDVPVNPDDPEGPTTPGLSIIAFKVVGPDGNPLINSLIRLVDLDVESTTDENGIVIFENIPLGTHKILGIFNGREFTQEIDITSSDRIITVTLQEDSTNSSILIISVAILIAVILVLVAFIIINRRKSAINNNVTSPF